MNLFEELKGFEVFKDLLIVLLIYSYFKLLRYFFISSLEHFEESPFAKAKNKFILFVLAFFYTLIGSLLTFYLLLVVIGFAAVGIIISTINWIIVLHICTIYYCLWKCFLYFILGEFTTFDAFDSITLDQLKKLKFPKKNK